METLRRLLVDAGLGSLSGDQHSGHHCIPEPLAVCFASDAGAFSGSLDSRFRIVEAVKPRGTIGSQETLHDLRIGFE